jgi:pimeloyl-ACP methyl ester carboxylesterase
MVTPVLGRLMGATLGRPSLKNTRRFFSKLIVAHLDRMPDELIELETLHARVHGPSIARLFRAGASLRGFRPRYVIGDELHKLSVPTTFLWGEHDAFMAVEEGSEVSGAVPGSRFEVILDAGHLPSTDQPEAVAEALERELLAVETAL